MAFPIELLTPGKVITNEDLTTKQINGEGTFDHIMASIFEHLKGEYDSNRITGQEYTKAYIALVNGALQNAVQFLLQKDVTYWQRVLLQQQLDGILIDNATKQYNLDNILPKQKDLIQEQIEVQRAQTMNTRTDGATIVGSVGKQKDLYEQQITSYKRDAEVKAVRIFTDAWITQKTMDEGLDPPGAFANPSLNIMLKNIKKLNNLEIVPPDQFGTWNEVKEDDSGYDKPVVTP